MQYKKQAFTLVEMVVSVSIITILWIIGFISFTSYHMTIRDTARISDIENISLYLNDFKLRNNLPQPANYVQLESDSQIVSQQWELSDILLNLIGYESAGRDPMDDKFFTYVRSWNKKYFQVMWLLESQDNVPGQNNQNDLEIKAQRFPYTQGNKLWIVTDEENIPLEKILAGSSITIDSYTQTIYTYLENNQFIYWTWSSLLSLEETNLKGWKYCKIQNNVIVCGNTHDDRQKWTGLELFN